MESILENSYPSEYEWFAKQTIDKENILLFDIIRLYFVVT